MNDGMPAGYDRWLTTPPDYYDEPDEDDFDDDDEFYDRADAEYERWRDSRLEEGDE